MSGSLKRYFYCETCGANLDGVYEPWRGAWVLLCPGCEGHPERMVVTPTQREAYAGEEREALERLIARDAEFPPILGAFHPSATSGGVSPVVLEIGVGREVADGTPVNDGATRPRTRLSDFEWVGRPAKDAIRNALRAADIPTPAPPFESAETLDGMPPAYVRVWASVEQAFGEWLNAFAACTALVDARGWFSWPPVDDPDDEDDLDAEDDEDAQDGGEFEDADPLHDDGDLVTSDLEWDELTRESR